MWRGFCRSRSWVQRTFLRGAQPFLGSLQTPHDASSVSPEEPPGDGHSLASGAGVRAPSNGKHPGCTMQAPDWGEGSEPSSLLTPTKLTPSPGKAQLKHSCGCSTPPAKRLLFQLPIALQSMGDGRANGHRLRPGIHPLEVCARCHWSFARTELSFRE